MDIRLTIVILTKYVGCYMTSGFYRICENQVCNLHSENASQSRHYKFDDTKKYFKKSTFIIKKKDYKIRPKFD